jgi:hypothetical protein
MFDIRRRPRESQDSRVLAYDPRAAEIPRQKKSRLQCRRPSSDRRVANINKSGSRSRRSGS